MTVWANCPKCGNYTLRIEDKGGYLDVSWCEYKECDYADPGVPDE